MSVVGKDIARPLRPVVQRICRDEGMAVMLVAHDVNPILGYLDRVVYFAGGTAVEGITEYRLANGF